jgi:hypothetical protein
MRLFTHTLPMTVDAINLGLDWWISPFGQETIGQALLRGYKYLYDGCSHLILDKDDNEVLRVSAATAKRFGKVRFASGSEIWFDNYPLARR